MSYRVQHGQSVHAPHMAPGCPARPGELTRQTAIASQGPREPHRHEEQKNQPTAGSNTCDCFQSSRQFRLCPLPSAPFLNTHLVTQSSLDIISQGSKDGLFFRKIIFFLSLFGLVSANI